MQNAQTFSQTVDIQAGSTHIEWLLEVVTACITAVMRAESVKKILPQNIETIANAVHFDRMLIIEEKSQRHESAPPLIYFVWESAQAPRVGDVGAIIAASPHHALFAEWLRPLHSGKAVTGSIRSSSAPIQELLGQLKVMSVLQVPIMVSSLYWGHISLDDCKGEHEWTQTQVNILKLFAGMVGTAITRERSFDDLRQRDALLAAVNESALEIMTAPYLHEAISNSLPRVAKAVRADRMFLIEIARERHSKPQVLLRNYWHSPEVSLELDAVLRALSMPAQEVLDWVRPLRTGQDVRGSVNGATGALKEFFTRLKVQSVLMVPVLVDGKLWGQISFDDCKQDRDWSTGEVDILKTLAQLIGTAITRERYTEELTKANTIVQNSPTILYRLRGEPAFPMIYISQNIALFGHDASELLNSPTLYQSNVHPEDRSKVQTTMVELLRKNALPSTIEHRMLTSTGESRWVENRYTPVRDTNGRLVEVEGIMIDITERKIAEERIALLARTDVLTGLANRATFGDRLRQAFAAAKRGAASFAVLYLDLDRFKEVNDTRGHGTGDALLKMVAERLRNITRESDVVARLGGDEFAILQSEVHDTSVASVLADKVVTALSAPYMIDTHEARIGCSVGIALFAEETADGEVMLAQADQALYRAKEEGRGQYRYYSDELDAEAREQIVLAADLRKALERDELELYYQPQVELSTGRIVGMEALIRWNHPQRGLLLPDVFLPVAEKAGLTRAFGRWVLDGACKQLAQWRAAEVTVPVVAVNVALAQIKMGKEFVRDVKESLSRWKLQPGDLELDVTEFILARATLAQNNVLEELQRLGVCIAIDDFGAQYSSLDYLRTYRVGRLKIARPMVAAAADQQGDATMIRAIIGLASELGVEVIAEGVETEAQRELLVNMSAKTRGQGYFFSKPMPAEDTIEILRLGAKEPGEK